MKYIFLTFLFLTNIFADELINVNFKELDLKELIKITSENINKNILITQEVKGKVDFISTEAISKNELLNILKYSLEGNGYKLIEKNNILRVVKNDILIEKEVNEPKVNIVKYIKNSSSQKRVQNFTEVIFLKNIEAKNLEKILKSIISQRVYSNAQKPSIAIDEESNSIIIDGSIEEIERLKSLISKLDISKPQVYVKAKIVELDNNLLEEIGINYGIFGGKSHSGGLYTFSSNLNEGNAIAIDTGSIGLQIPNVSSTLALGASLNLLNKTYALDVISEPSILCLDNKESSIYVGETVSIQTGSTVTDGGNTKSTFKREDIGLILKVKPRVSNENKVILEINTILEGIKNINTVSLNPNTSKKEVNTTAIVNNGESIILGGLIENKNQKSVQKIPVAGDIPLIGELFKNRLKDFQNKNLTIIVTPYIIPKNKDLSFVRKELSKLKTLEDEFLEKVLISLKQKKNSNLNIKKEKQRASLEEEHKKRLKEYLGI